MKHRQEKLHDLDETCATCEPIVVVAFVNEFDNIAIAAGDETEAAMDVEWEKYHLPHLPKSHTNYFLMEVKT